MLAANGRHEKAIEVLEEALKIQKAAGNPDHISARLSLIEILVQRGKTKEAQKFADESQEIVSATRPGV